MVFDQPRSSKHPRHYLQAVLWAEWPSCHCAVQNDQGCVFKNSPSFCSLCELIWELSWSFPVCISCAMIKSGWLMCPSPQILTSLGWRHLKSTHLAIRKHILNCTSQMYAIIICQWKMKLNLKDQKLYHSVQEHVKMAKESNFKICISLTTNYKLKINYNHSTFSVFFLVDLLNSKTNNGMWFIKKSVVSLHSAVHF